MNYIYESSLVRTMLKLNKDQLSRFKEFCVAFKKLIEQLGTKNNKNTNEVYSFLRNVEYLTTFKTLPPISKEALIIKTSPCFEDHLFDILQHFINERTLNVLYQYLKDDKYTSIIDLCDYISNNFEKQNIMLENIKRIEAVYSNFLFTESTLDKDYKFINKGKMHRGIISDGKKIFTYSPEDGEYPFTLKDANFIIKYSQISYFNLHGKLIVNNLTFDGEYLPKNSIEEYNMINNPNIPYDFYNNINSKINELYKYLEFIDQYTNKMKEIQTMLASQNISFEIDHSIKEILEKKYQEAYAALLNNFNLTEEKIALALSKKKQY